MKRSSPLLATGLLIAAHTGLAQPAIAQVATVSERARLAERMAEYHGQPGAVIAVVRGGRVVLAEGFGVANLEHGIPLGRETVLDIGSVAKQFTGFAIALLADEGKLSLDDDIRTHLPEVPDFGEVITIRHMIHHMSGLREIYTAEGIAGRQNGDAVQQADALRLTEHMHELNFTPGDRYLYCNTAYMMLADIVARASGMPFPEFMTERVFGPIGMAHTTIMSKLGQSIPGVAESYAEDDDEEWVRVFDNSSLYGAGGMYSTVDDLAAWMRNYSTAAVGGPAVIEQMQQRGVLNDGEELTYAFGINVGELRGERVIRHTGSSAGFRASFTYFPDLEGGVITLSNRANIGGGVPADIIEIFFGEELEPVPAEAPDDDESETEDEPSWSPTPRELGALAGTWFSAELETVYTLFVEDGTLMGRHRRHGTFELEPTESHTFRGPGFFGTATFEGDDAFRISNGRVLDLLFRKVDLR